MKKHKYVITIEFESEEALKLHDQDLIQFENGLPYFADAKTKGKSLNNSFVYGTGKVKLKKVGK